MATDLGRLKRRVIEASDKGLLASAAKLDTRAILPENRPSSPKRRRPPRTLIEESHGAEEIAMLDFMLASFDEAE
ncbi:hypothetical protein [Pseudooceanicola sp.]|uniref:hypothetical protein n=1 Tax=Pseudooceanicola sp. TaxID=1914328 RepID=UPI003515BE8E